jgi:hypothetical protein
MENWKSRGWDHIRKFIPLDWSVIFRRTKKVALTKLLIGRNTCPILAFSGFPEIPGSSTSFTNGRLANQGMGSHPKIHPPGLVGDFQVALTLATTPQLPYHPCCQKHVGAKNKCVCDNKCICIYVLS